MSEQEKTKCRECHKEIVLIAEGREGLGFWRLAESGEVFDGAHYHEPSPEPEAAPERSAARGVVRFAYLPIGSRFRCGRAGTVVFQKTDEDHAASLEHPDSEPFNFELSHPCYVVAEAAPASEAQAPAAAKRAHSACGRDTERKTGMSEIQFQKTFYGIAASLVEGDKVTSGIGRTYSEAEEALREKISNRAEPSPEPEAAPDTSQNSPETWDRPDLDYLRTPGISADRDRESDAQSGNPWYPTDEPQPAAQPPASEAQLGTSALYVTKAAYDARVAELVQLRAIVDELFNDYLDVQSAVHAWQEVAQQFVDTLRAPGPKMITCDHDRLTAAIAAYDALAGKGE